MAVMFHFMMAWLFIYRRQSRVRILLCSLMALMGVNYFKDLFFLANPDNVEGAFSVYSPFIASIDITALPLFVLVLIELCFPRFLTFFKGTVIIAPFALCVALFLHPIFTHLFPAVCIVCSVWNTCYNPCFMASAGLSSSDSARVFQYQ